MVTQVVAILLLMLGNHVWLFWLLGQAALWMVLVASLWSALDYYRRFGGVLAHAKATPFDAAGNRDAARRPRVRSRDSHTMGKKSAQAPAESAALQDRSRSIATFSSVNPQVRVLEVLRAPGTPRSAARTTAGPRVRGRGSPVRRPGGSRRHPAVCTRDPRRGFPGSGRWRRGSSGAYSRSVRPGNWNRSGDRGASRSRARASARRFRRGEIGRSAR